MPSHRRPSKHLRAPRPLNSASHAVKRATAAGTYLVREVPSDRATKAYLCPGCSNPIAVGLSHVVAWPESPGLGYDTGLDERRHWHRHCWRLHR